MNADCENSVNCLVIPEIMELICIPRYLYLAKIDLHICIHRRNAMEHWNADWCINSVNDQATPGINLVGFW